MNEGCATYCHYRIMTRLHEQRADQRRRFPGIPARRTPMSCSSRSSTIPRLRRHQPLCARLRHDAGHRAHLHRADRGGPRLVPRDRRQRRSLWRAAGSAGRIIATRASSPSISAHASSANGGCSISSTTGEDAASSRVEAIHDERGYRRIRRALARQYDIGHGSIPNIQVVDVDLAGDPAAHAGAPNSSTAFCSTRREAQQVLQHLADLWGYEVCLQEVSSEAKTIAREHSARADSALIMK